MDVWSGVFKFINAVSVLLVRKQCHFLLQKGKQYAKKNEGGGLQSILIFFLKL